MTYLGNCSQSPSLRLAVLLLAAGEGSRLGSIPKALIQKNGQSLLRHFCLAIKPFSPVEFLVLTGFHAQAIESELARIKDEMDLQVESVRNLNPQQGQAASVRLGIESLSSNYDALLIALSDQPEITSVHIRALIEEFEKRPADCEIVLPLVDGLRGNPVLFSRKAIEEILMNPGMTCRSFMDSHPELVYPYASTLSAYILDVDTQADMQKLKLQLP